MVLFWTLLSEIAGMGCPSRLFFGIDQLNVEVVREEEGNQMVVECRTRFRRYNEPRTL